MRRELAVLNPTLVLLPEAINTAFNPVDLPLLPVDKIK